MTINESFKENKKINTRQSTSEKKKPSTPVHKTNLKLKKENNVMNYSTNNAKKSTSGKSMDVIHDMKMGLKKATTDRKDINLKTKNCFIRHCHILLMQTRRKGQE